MSSPKYLNIERDAYKTRDVLVYSSKIIADVIGVSFNVTSAVGATTPNSTSTGTTYGIIVDSLSVPSALKNKAIITEYSTGNPVEHGGQRVYGRLQVSGSPGSYTYITQFFYGNDLPHSFAVEITLQIDFPRRYDLLSIGEEQWLLQGATGQVTQGSGLYPKFEAATGTKNGVNRDFNTSIAYFLGSLMVMIRGTVYSPSEIQQNGGTSFRILGEPIPQSNDDALDVYYLYEVT